MAVYLLKINEFYKIGFTKNIKQRFPQIRNSSPFSVKLIGFFENYNYKDEQLLHKKFKHCREKREWFFLSREEIDSFVNNNLFTIKNDNYYHYKNRGCFNKDKIKKYIKKDIYLKTKKKLEKKVKEKQEKKRINNWDLNIKRNCPKENQLLQTKIIDKFLNNFEITSYGVHIKSECRENLKIHNVNLSESPEFKTRIDEIFKRFDTNGMTAADAILKRLEERKNKIIAK